MPAAISTGLDPHELALQDSLGQLSGLDRSAMMKTLLRKSIADMRLELAANPYRKEKVRFSRAAEIAGIS